MQRPDTFQPHRLRTNRTCLSTAIYHRYRMHSPAAPSKCSKAPRLRCCRGPNCRHSASQDERALLRFPGSRCLNSTTVRKGTDLPGKPSSSRCRAHPARLSISRRFRRVAPSSAMESQHSCQHSKAAIGPQSRRRNSRRFAFWP